MKISFDLDETLFVNPAEVPAEPDLKFPYNKIYKDKLRKGAVELLTEINKSGWELWIYTTSNRSEGYIRRLFRHYGISIDSVVNAPRHEAEVVRGRADFPSKCPAAYHIDLHVDDEKSVYENGIANGFNVYRITNDDTDWVENIRKELERIKRNKGDCALKS